MRMTHSQKKLNTLSDNENNKMGQQLIRVCNPKTEEIKMGRNRTHKKAKKEAKEAAVLESKSETMEKAGLTKEEE